MWTIWTVHIIYHVDYMTIHRDCLVDYLNHTQRPSWGLSESHSETAMLTIWTIRNVHYVDYLNYTQNLSCGLTKPYTVFAIWTIWTIRIPLWLEYLNYIHTQSPIYIDYLYHTYSPLCGLFESYMRKLSVYLGNNTRKRQHWRKKNKTKTKTEQCLDKPINCYGRR